ncbi:DoxX family protein [Corynebacterium sp. H130]|uniref:DoxX family protein n=1 Tax=Corynebacterium sp. H130 TaxID=3133444 RepID=UPI0030B43C97
MTNNSNPDRLQPADLDDLDNVPTYDSKGLGKFYERYGRSAPQSIDPTPEEAMSQPEPTQNLYKVSADPEPTASFDAPKDYQATAPTAYEAPAPVAYEEPVVAAAAVDKPEVQSFADARRGTIDFGLMIIRLVVGGLLTFQAAQTFFELGGAPGIDGLREQFSNYAMGDILAIAIPTMQLLAGVFLVFGLLTPVAASIATAVTGFGAVNAIAQADGLNAMNPGDSVILPILLAVLALGLQFTGPGKISFDVARSWAQRPLASSWIWAIIGIAGAVAMWWFLAGVNPLG